MADNITTGTIGEQMAADYLKRGGYKILETNVKYPWGEIDIVAKDHDKTLVFVEVKTLNKRGQKIEEGAGLKPEDNLTRSKMSKLKKSCSFFANNNKRLANNGWRIDLLSLTIYDECCDVRHLKNIGEF
jgi:putative endonuclease